MAETATASRTIAAPFRRENGRFHLERESQATPTSAHRDRLPANRTKSAGSDGRLIHQRCTRWPEEAVPSHIVPLATAGLVVLGRDVGDSCIGEDLRVEW